MKENNKPKAQSIVNKTRKEKIKTASLNAVL